ncbi:MAG: outer membrane beta-barrel protein, partial [Flavipsychrobacter sp.]|nr:outer membrane beta-barrel protein [Flavipsychrobacter sp.]
MKQLLFLSLALQAMTSYAQDSARVPFEGMDMTWQNGTDRRQAPVLQTKYFTGSVLLDVNYNYSFNRPVDNTVVGSTAMARTNEVQLSSANIGGEFYYEGARAKLMTQFGTR